MTVLFRRLDGTFVILLNGLPYHVTQDNPLFAAAQAAGADAPLEPALPAPTIAENRARTVLRRLAFANALKAAQILTHAERIEFLQRKIPAPLAAMLQTLQPSIQQEAEATLIGAEEFPRVDPFWTELVAAGTVTEQTLDAVFGVSA